MNITFYSFIDGKRYEIKEELIEKDNHFFFKDKENEGHIEYYFLDGNIYFKRHGNANINIIFNLNKNTLANYENNMGLKFDFLVKTKRLEIQDEKIIVEYDYFLDGNFQANVKLYLLVENTLEKK